MKHVKDHFARDNAEQDRISVSALSGLRSSHTILDVRTKEEYLLGHIPSAVSLELFNSDERAQVGLMYKQRGRDDAVKLGFEIVNPKIATLISEIEELVSEDKVIVHCWRGGMRSASMAWLISLALNKEVLIIDGGYKAYRNYVLDTFRQNYDFVIVGGFTGSAKTEILQELSRLGEQVVDLEGIAVHRGSAFGGIGLEVQPNQQTFENMLSEDLQILDANKTIWLEDESRRIGSRTIPMDLFSQMKQSSLVFLDIPFEARIDHLMKSYGTFDIESLSRSTGKLERRLGLEKMTEVKLLIENGKIADACRILLRYYDKSYEYGLSKKQEGKIRHMECESISPARIAEQLIRDRAKLNTD